nr:galactokinase [Clostridia bacterium]
MKPIVIKSMILGGAMRDYSYLYPDADRAGHRILRLIDKFTSLFGNGRDIYVFSVPGRSEILGNHTDHNRGCVLAGAIDRDVLAVAARNDEGQVRFHSEGYAPDRVVISETRSPDRFEKYTSSALIAGVVRGFESLGYAVGGYDCCAESEVLKGSGISSSAAYEVMVGNILNHLYNDGAIDNKELAKIAQYAENKYFGKPSGLMDQMACAVGGFVYIDFENYDLPVVEPIGFSLKDKGYSLCIVNTGGSHADLNDDYASIPVEMREVAVSLGREVLSTVTEEELSEKIPTLRRAVGDRAILRAIHFIRENERVREAKAVLESKDAPVESLFDIINRSGRSSFEYLQNVYTVSSVKEQGLSLALALTEGFLQKEGLAGRSAMRVHGGGFAGTIQVFLPTSALDKYIAYIDTVFGEGSAMPLNIRPVGACRLF